jgi:ABC-type glucose/galactose transport system permease subunit
MPASDVPAIYSPRFDFIRLPIRHRAAFLVVAGLCLALMVIASALKPNPSGMGTHTALGLQACGFYQRTGLPCPTCGMTTSFAWFARGNIGASLYVQPMGTLLATLTVAGFWTCLYIALTGRAVYRMGRIAPEYLFWPLLLGGLIAWAWKIFIHLHGIDGWKA